MSRKRPSIAVMMTVVLIIALDCATLRYPLLEILLVLGVMPMANILAVAMLPFLYSRRWDIERRRQLTGFLWSGGGAMIAVIFLSLRSPDALAGLVAMIANPVMPLGIPTFLGVAIVILLIPQLGMAVIGGAIYDRYGCSEWGDGSVMEGPVNPPALV